MASSLTEEQRKRIEENKRRALEIRASKFQASSNNFVKAPPLVSVCTSLKTNTSVIGIQNKQKELSFRNGSCKSYDKNHSTNSKIITSNGKPTNSVASSNFYNKKDTISLSCCLISRDRFVANAGYSKELIELFKTIPGKLYDAKTLKWSFPLSQYQYFKTAVHSTNLNISIVPIPNYVLKVFSRSSSSPDYKSVDVSSIDDTLLHSLYPFQLEGVQFGISKNGRCIIADDMGLGKTIQALGIADYYKHDWPLLIVCPSSMRYQWEQEITSCLPSVSLSELYVMNTSKDKLSGSQVVITSYDLMSRCENILKPIGFGVVIMDESHSMKSMKTNRTKVALSLIQSARRCILLSGTPALSRPSELFPQIKAINPHAFSLKEFGVRYCDGKENKFGWDFSGSSNMEELKLLLEEKFMIRRLKSTVLDQLPSKVREIVILDSQNIKMESKVMTAFAEKLNAPNVKGMEKRGTLLSYFAETAKIKIKAVQCYISHLLEEEEKFLIFGHHRQMLDAICSLLEDKKTYYIRIDGSTSSEERKSVCDQFQFEDRFKVAVLSITAASTGITLTAAHLVVFAELFWNPGVLTQAEDRVHRIGQQDSVLVQYLIAKGTADDHLWPLIQSKLNILNKAGLSKDNFLCANTLLKKDKKQSTILNFFEELNADCNDKDLNSLMDEIDGVECKRLKMQ